MAVKKIGTLNKHENPATNENEFDIENYMNANWDKIKEVVDNNADELSETQINKVDKVDGKGLSTEDYTTAEKQKLAGLNNYDDTEIKEDIQDIKSEQTTQNTKLQELEDNQIHITTERASNLNVQDASGQNAKINVFGISKQETRSGKNILNATMSNNVINGITYTKNSDGSVTANGTATNTSYITVNGASPLELKANTQYRLTGCSKNGSNSTYMLVTNILGANTHYDTGNGITFSLEEDSDVNVNIRITAGTTVSNLIFYPMLRLANNGDDSFEQYGETPSLEYLSEIKNTGDNINIFNLEEYIEFYDLTETGTDEGHNYVAYTTKTYENNKFMQGKFKANTQYTISFLGRQKQAVQGQTSGFALNYTDGTSNIKYVNNDEVWTEYTLTSDKNKTIDYVSMAWAYGGTIWLSNIKLEEGTNATSYSNYGCGNVEITDCNKNLFNIETAMQNYILNDAGIEIASQGAFVSDYILVKKDVNYFSNTRGYTNAGFYDLDKNFIKRDTVAQNATTIFDDDYYIKLNGKMENIIAFQFERNNTATDFEAHEEEVKTFPLSQNQKMFEGDYLADDGIHHKRKQIAFDGTENWALYAGYANNAEKGYCYYLNIADCKIVKDTSISTHFKNVFGAYQESVGYIGAFSDNLSVKNKYFISDKENLEKFKAYLAEQKTAGTPVKLEYELETEEIEAYTEEQQTQRDQLQNAKTYKTVTNVFTDNAEVEMNYIADTKTYVDNEINSIKEQLNTINELLSTTTTSAMLLDNMQSDLESEVL